MLQFDKLSLQRGPQPLFTDVNFQIHPGQRVGITGANGTGKTSLFSLVLGNLTPEVGDFKRPANWVLATVSQEISAPDRQAIDYVLDGDAELRRLEHQLDIAEQDDDGHQIAELHASLDHIGGYQASARAAQLMHGLGFCRDDEQKKVATFSGGWQMRLHLARALMCRSDLLLLDEPTNHLDLDAVLWLEKWLKSYPGTLLLISHDRDFLDGIATQIAHIEQHRIQLYTGNYSAFEQVRSQQLANQQSSFEKQQREIKHIQSYVDRFRAKATKARQAQSRLKALERMELIAPAHVDSPFHFSFKSPERNPTPLLSLDQVSVGYQSTALLSRINLTLTPGDRIGLLGPNGAGKSTLIKLLANDLQPLTGRREDARYLKTGYFAQHQLEQLHPEHSPVEHLMQLHPNEREQALRSFLGGFGFLGDKALEPVAPFSGGEKARLVLAMLVSQRPNLLLLDEPTNHLDLEMRQALAQALQTFEGAMVLVSHDRHLLRVCTDRLLIVGHGRVEEFDQSLDDYPAWLQKMAQQSQTTGQQKRPAIDRKKQKRLEAEQRKQLSELRKTIKKLESKLSRQSDKQKEIEDLLSDNSLYQDENKDNLKSLLAEKTTLDQQIDSTEHQWLEATEQLDIARE